MNLGLIRGSFVWMMSFIALDCVDEFHEFVHLNAEFLQVVEIRNKILKDPFTLLFNTEYNGFIVSTHHLIMAIRNISQLVFRLFLLEVLRAYEKSELNPVS